MQKIFVMAIVSCLSIILVGCSKDSSDNPYTETHIVSVAPDYKIEPRSTLNLKKPINQMTEEELKTRLGELQRETLSFTPAQQKEFNLISERLRELSSNN